MRQKFGPFTLFVVASVLLAAAMFVGCQQAPAQPVVVQQAAPADPSPAVVYDETHRDNHPWDSHESSAYLRWESENHRPHVEIKIREPKDQTEYWNWRHTHPDPNDRH